MDNQQQISKLPMQPQRPVKDLLVLGVVGTLVGLSAIWALKEMFPDSMPS